MNLTRFSVQFPEKRDFFLEGQDTFTFANGSSGTGGRLLGRHGLWRYGLLNIQTGGAEGANTPATNFSVVRVNRDFLRRSRIGGTLTRRDPVAATKCRASGSDNLAYGFDTLISQTNDISILGQARYGPRPRNFGGIRKLFYIASLDYITDTKGSPACLTGPISGSPALRRRAARACR